MVVARCNQRQSPEELPYTLQVIKCLRFFHLSLDLAVSSPLELIRRERRYARRQRPFDFALFPTACRPFMHCNLWMEWISATVDSIVPSSTRVEWLECSSALELESL
jgi:hypothetical protein